MGLDWKPIEKDKREKRERERDAQWTDKIANSHTRNFFGLFPMRETRERKRGYFLKKKKKTWELDRRGQRTLTTRPLPLFLFFFLFLPPFLTFTLHLSCGQIFLFHFLFLSLSLFFEIEAWSFSFLVAYGIIMRREGEKEEARQIGDGPLSSSSSSAAWFFRGQCYVIILSMG